MWAEDGGNLSGLIGNLQGCGLWEDGGNLSELPTDVEKMEICLLVSFGRPNLQGRDAHQHGWRSHDDLKHQSFFEFCRQSFLAVQRESETALYLPLSLTKRHLTFFDIKEPS